MTTTNQSIMFGTFSAGAVQTITITRYNDINGIAHETEEAATNANLHINLGKMASDMIRLGYTNSKKQETVLRNFIHDFGNYLIDPEKAVDRKPQVKETVAVEVAVAEQAE